MRTEDKDGGSGAEEVRVACLQSTRCWEVCQTRVSDFARLGLGFFVRSGSRILRCLVGWRWLRCADICRLVRCGVFVVPVLREAGDLGDGHGG